MREATLCFLIKDNQILLAMKKRGFGVGKWNGVGGKVEQGEGIKQAALREMKEEIGVSSDLDDLEEMGFIDFFFPHKTDWNQRVPIFFIKNWIGEPEESEEMKPQWFEQERVPYGEMWCDDPHWLPVVLRGNVIQGKFCFSPDGNDFDSYKIKLI